MLEIVCVPIIVFLVFSIMEIYKKLIAKNNETLIRIIPIIAFAIGVILGVILGIICFYAYSEIITATDIGTAILIGGVSGLSTTGFNQVFKQMRKFGVDVKETEEINGENSDNSFIDSDNS